MRAIAVIAVLLFHFQIYPFSGGFVGVDIFFVISGFFITAMVVDGMARNTFDLGRFYAFRITRICPALLAVLVAVLLFGWFVLDPMEYKDLGQQAVSAVLFGSNFLFFLTEGYFSADASSTWLLHTWSLAVEFQFYLLFPIYLLIVNRIFPHKVHYFVAGACILSFLFACALVFAGAGSERLHSFSFYMFPARAWEILLGGCVWIFRCDLGRRLSILAEIAGLGLILVSCLVFDGTNNWPIIDRFLPVLGAAMVIAANRGRSSLLRAGPFQDVGLASYSIYLWHWPIVVALRYLDMDAPLQTFGALIATLAIGHLSYRFIERPVQNLRRAYRGGRAIMPVVPAVLLVLAASVSIVISQGAFFRTPAAARQNMRDAMAAMQDWAFPVGQCDGLDRSGNLRSCRIGQQPSMLLVGDSHAQMWYPRLVELATTQGLSVDIVSMAGCSPVPGLGKTTNRKCLQFNQKLKPFIDEASYRDVVISASWDLVFREEDRSTSFCFADARGLCAPEDKRSIAARAKPAFTAFVEDLLRRGKRVTIIVNTPVLPVDVPRTLAKHAFWGEDGRQSVSFSKAAILQTMKGETEFLSSLAGRGAVIKDALRWCAGDGCSGMDEKGAIRFKDDNHMRSSFVRANDYWDDLFQ